MTPSVLFYCPLKPPDECVPSGVSRIAALFVKALRSAGFAVEVPSLPSTFEPAGNPASQEALIRNAEAAAQELVRGMRSHNVRPRAWMTYHCYYKSPDVVGPLVAKEFGCPYLIAEGSHARKRAAGPWEMYHARASAALAGATGLLAATKRDLQGLATVPDRLGEIFDFPPFVDVYPFSAIVRSPSDGQVRILAAGSMRDDRKLRSYHRLFDGLGALPPKVYCLKIAGDGPGRAELEQRAAPLRDAGAQVDFLGRLSPKEMPNFFANGDVFAWPGVGEAYGLTYLEAQASGLPVIAEDYGGVAACVRDGISGRLVQPSDEDAFGEALRQIVSDGDLRRALGQSAFDWVTAERTLTVAAKRLAWILKECGA